MNAQCCYMKANSCKLDMQCLDRNSIHYAITLNCYNTIRAINPLKGSGVR